MHMRHNDEDTLLTEVGRMPRSTYRYMKRAGERGKRQCPGMSGQGLHF